MSVNNFKPTIWSREVLFSLKNRLIANNLVNRNYQGEINNEGDTVRIQTPDAIQVGDYTGANINFETITSGTQSLEIDQSKYFAFLVDDVDQAQANVNLMQTYMVEAAHALAKTADTFIFESYADAAEENVIDDGFTEDNAYEILTEAAKRLSQADVPDEGRWVVVDPAGIKALSNDPAFQRASDLGDQTSRFGFMGMAAGFNVWMSNNLITTSGDPDTTHYLYGHNIAITFAEQINSVEAGRREAGFSDFVKGLHLYGKKVVRPTALGTIEVLQGS
jgi:hypothetical protein